jgi:mannan endo-1,4-beta-mannosidase
MQNRSQNEQQPRIGVYLLSAVVAVTGTTGCLRLKQPQSAPSGSAAGKKHIDASGTIEVPKFEPTNRPNAVFEVDGKPYCFEGTNNYYLNFKNRNMVDDVFARAKRLGLGVMRMWAYLDRGSLDNSVPPMDSGDKQDGTKEGHFAQYWDTKTKQPAYNDGASGLEMVDYALHAARQSGIKVMLVLTNNWRDFGGMDQYLTWYGLNQHHLFYTDERVRTAFKNWAAHLVNRKNTIDGVFYKDDPIIFAWELANEPRTRNYRNFDSLDGWDLNTIPRWADEMSQYIHSIDPNHMVSVGDEGQFAEGKRNDFYLGKDGVDHKALLALKGIDFGTFHLYPETWSTGIRWSYDWVKDHIKAAYAANKPTVLEEYGLVIRREPGKGMNPGKPLSGEERRIQSYRQWNDIVLQEGGAGSMFWLLVGKVENGDIYPDYDHFTVYEDEKSAVLIKEYAAKFNSEARACLLAPPAQVPPSPFVRVRHVPQTEVVADLDVSSSVVGARGWLALM